MLITSMITDRIGRHEVLSPINNNHYNFREYYACIPFCERAFNTNYPKLGKLSLAETLSNVTNSSILKNSQFGVVVVMVIAINSVIGVM